MKKIISVLLCFVMICSFASCKKPSNVDVDTTPPVQSSENEFAKTGKEFCSQIVAGWNLGNTLDACEIWGNMPSNPTIQQQETAWNNPVTTQDMIDKVVDSGFNGIRIPVTWYLQVEENDDYTIKQEWLARVKEVADYSIKAGAYTIVNMHHDDQYWLNISADDEEWETIKIKYQKIWEQIADLFKDYGEKLILEGANEITATTEFDAGDCYNGENGSGKCWWGHNQKVFDRQNELYKIFVETVRNSGGNNEVRYLMLPTYGAQWYDNQINKLYVPENDNHIIMDVHWYQPNRFLKSENKWVFETMRNFANKHNIGAILGESGLMASASDYDKKCYGENVVGGAKEYDIPVFLWDDGGDLEILNRQELTWNSEEYVKSVVDFAKNTKVLY